MKLFNYLFNRPPFLQFHINEPHKNKHGFEKKQFVPHSIFHGYLFGGRTWPQVRGPTNIAVLYQWSKQAKNGKDDLVEFALSRLNPKQIKAAKAAMISDHQNAGIVLSIEASDELMQAEWLKTKQIALLSIGQFVQKKLEKDAVPLLEKDIVHYAKSLKINEEDLAFIKEQAVIAYALVFKEHVALARLYKTSLYKSPQKEFHENSSLKQKSFIYGIKQTDEADIIRKTCCRTIMKILNDKLSPSAPSDWIAWGFEQSYRKK